MVKKKQIALQAEEKPNGKWTWFILTSLAKI